MFNSNLRYFCCLLTETDQARLEMYSLHLLLGRSLGCFPVGVACSTCTSPSFPGAFWSRDLTNGAGISRFEEVVRHSGFHEFHSCAFCREVSNLFAKIPSLPLERRIMFFQSIPKPLSKLTALRCLSSRFVNTDLCINLLGLRLPSLVNTTPRYLNVCTCCSVLPLTCSIH